MTETGERRPYGMLLLILAGAAGIGLSIYNYLANEGINHTAGAAGMIGTTAALAVGGLLIANLRFGPGWLRVIVLLLLLLDILVTGIAGWFLETWLLMAFMFVALVGWLLHVVLGPRWPRRMNKPVHAEVAV